MERFRPGDEVVSTINTWVKKYVVTRHTKHACYVQACHWREGTPYGQFEVIDWESCLRYKNPFMAYATSPSWTPRKKLQKTETSAKMAAVPSQ